MLVTQTSKSLFPYVLNKDDYDTSILRSVDIKIKQCNTLPEETLKEPQKNHCGNRVENEAYQFLF